MILNRVGMVILVEQGAREACVREVNEEVGLDVEVDGSAFMTIRIGTSAGTSVQRIDVFLQATIRQHHGRKPVRYTVGQW